MGRPKIKTKKIPVNMTFEPEFRAEAADFAYQMGESLSEMTERLIAEEMARVGRGPAKHLKAAQAAEAAGLRELEVRSRSKSKHPRKTSSQE